MTRDEALAKLQDSVLKRPLLSDAEYAVRVLEDLGLIKFDDPKDWNHLQALAKALSDTVDSGRSLTSARVNAALESYGFKIVRA